MKDFLARTLGRWREQTALPSAPNRLQGTNVVAAVPVAETSTRPGEDGRTRRLFIPDVSPLNSGDYYLGDDPIEPTGAVMGNG